LWFTFPYFLVKFKIRVFEFLIEIELHGVVLVLSSIILKFKKRTKTVFKIYEPRMELSQIKEEFVCFTLVLCCATYFSARMQMTVVDSIHNSALYKDSSYIFLDS
jgi:hypothetical protein